MVSVGVLFFGGCACVLLFAVVVYCTRKRSTPQKRSNSELNSPLMENQHTEEPDWTGAYTTPPRPHLALP